MSGPMRLADGGLIDRSRAVSFVFDGQTYQGYAGDSLASALLANGVVLFGRSFKYHRPRGVMAPGIEEPSALVQAGSGGRYEPNSRATDVFIYDGLQSQSQNRWPSLSFDLGGLNSLISPFIPAGFYYKTFFGGPKLWLLYEHLIRQMAGLGMPPTKADADIYEHRAAFCDVLVVGSGPAGLAAALSASAAGSRVILAEQDERLGGSLLTDPATIDSLSSDQWIAKARETLIAAGGRILTRTTAAGYYDHDLVNLVERLTEPGQTPGPDGLAQRLWRVRAGKVILATGAFERPRLFEGNDLPGVMLSGAVRTYLRRYGVRAGSRAVITTDNDDAYRTALALAEAGASIAAILDSRPADGVHSPLVQKAMAQLPVHFGAKLIAAKGSAKGLKGASALIDGKVTALDCDLIAVSGGFSPVVHLHMQAGGTLAWDELSGSFSPDQTRQNQTTVGAAAGADGLSATLLSGWSKASSKAKAKAAPTCASGDDVALNIIADWEPAPQASLKKAFVDYQNDVTAADLDLAWREGYRSVEHLKRYTTLGMATDQGKTSNLVGLARLAKSEGRPVPSVGLTTFRPPYTPVTLGVLAAEATGAHLDPRRRPVLYQTHAAEQPIWQPVGYWHRPRAYPIGAENLHQAAHRESLTVRTKVGVTDVSTLGKFDVSGPDAAIFLELICATTVGKLAVGRGRYTIMLREDGMVMDDGTVWRTEENRFLLTSSTGGADRMAAHLSYVRKVVAPHLKVAVANVQEHWAAVAVAGPLAKNVVAAVLPQMDVPRHMSLDRGELAGVPTLTLAASYSGERAFEIYAPSDQIEPVWAAIAKAARDIGGCLYGLEALEILRIEKGHIVVGGEIDGRASPYDLGLNKMLRPAGGYIGHTALQRPAFAQPGRLQMVGLEAVDGSAIPEGSMVLTAPKTLPVGHVTAAGLNVIKGGSIALGFLRDGFSRTGESLIAWSPTRNQTAKVKVTTPVFYDVAGVQYRD